jgi:methylenetetrahydrofolate dehydrogenase (NADP+) / methenyltetrahydrofolate cyclohydrolase
MPQIFSNQNLKDQFEQLLLQKSSQSQTQPVLHIIQIGDNNASTRYVNLKKKVASRFGIIVNHHHFDSTNVNPDKIVEITQIAKKNSEGLIFQLPIPVQFQDFVRDLEYKIDVDLLCLDSNKLWGRGLLPPTVLAIDLVLKQMLFGYDKNLAELLDSKVDLSSKTVVIVGQGALVGGPLIQYAKDRNATIISINKETINPQKLCLLGDIVISGAGVSGLIQSNWLNPNAVVVDAGTSGQSGVLKGDVNSDNLAETILLCPSPGGVGPITVYCLLWNLLQLQTLTS